MKISRGISLKMKPEINKQKVGNKYCAEICPFPKKLEEQMKQFTEKNISSITIFVQKVSEST